MAVSPPEPLGHKHHIGDFNSSLVSLDEWLKRRALVNQASGAARTFIVCDESRIVGYYALASGAVSVAAAPGRFRRNMPDPIPVAVLARLAVDKEYQRRGLGRALVQDGARRVLHAADVIGIRGILVHAISREAREFYVGLGFDSSPIDALTLMVTLADVRNSFF